MKKHPVATFFALAFVLSWYPTVLRTTGLVPSASGMNPLGVAVAAVLVAAMTQGWGGTKQLLARLIRFRVRPGWYLFVFGFPVLACFAAMGVAVLSGAKPNPPLSLPPRDLLDRFIFVFLFIGIGEETGWRGFAVAELAKRYSWRRVAFQVGAVWALWHLPLFGTEFRWSHVPAFLLGIFAASVLHTFIFLHTCEALPLQCAFHSTVNTVGAGWIFRMFSGSDLTKLWWAFSLIWVASAAFVLIRYGRQTNAAGFAPD